MTDDMVERVRRIVREEIARHEAELAEQGKHAMAAVERAAGNASFAIPIRRAREPQE